MDLFDRFRRRDPAPDDQTLRHQMAQNDPDFARVTNVQHEAISDLAAKRGADGMAIRREREHERRLKVLQDQADVYQRSPNREEPVGE